ncbi:MAG: DUF4158 domain-containing protein [Gammaproteobacteria bacterium]
MDRWHTSWLGLKQFPSELSAFDLDQFFTLSPADQQIVETRRRSVHRLGIALQIGFIRLSGCTLDAIPIVPQNVLRHMALQLHLHAPDIASLRALYTRKRTLYHH